MFVARPGPSAQAAGDVAGVACGWLSRLRDQHSRVVF
jgi:hypothetical protein